MREILNTFHLLFNSANLSDTRQFYQIKKCYVSFLIVFNSKNFIFFVDVWNNEISVCGNEKRHDWTFSKCHKTTIGKGSSFVKSISYYHNSTDKGGRRSFLRTGCLKPTNAKRNQDENPERRHFPAWRITLINN